jgi:hypothetical protein
MLKWLRKYNTYILVVGGCLLMIAFLMQGTLQDLSRRGIIGGKVMRVSGEKVTVETYQIAQAELASVEELVGGRGIVQMIGGVQNTDHWVLLTREAEAAGLVGGAEAGREFLPQMARFLAEQVAQRQFNVSEEQIKVAATQFEADMERRLPRVSGGGRLTEAQVLKAVEKLHGIMRLRQSYFGSPRYSDRRLITSAKELADSVEVEYVLVPADRKIEANAAEPSADAIRAHFDRFKDTPKNGGEFGIGYKLPERVKFTWLEINRKNIADKVVPDPVEVQKAFLRKYPTGKPLEGTTVEDAKKQVESTVKNELVDKIMKVAEEAVRAEMGRSVSKLETENGYKFLPKDWEQNRPDWKKIANTMVMRVYEQTGVSIPDVTVGERVTKWMEPADVRSIETIGRSSLRTGSRSEQFDRLLFSVREIAGANDSLLQVGVPFSDPVSDFTGNKYFFMVTDARKESAPDSLEEVRADIIKNIQRMDAFEKLKAQTEAYKARSIAEGLEAIAKPEDGATGEGLVPLKVETAAFEKTRAFSMAGDSAKIDSEESRNAVMAAAAKLDPLQDPTKLEPAQRTVVTPIAKSLSLFVGRIKALKPMTYELYRSRQMGITSRISSNELPRDKEEDDPFSLTNMEKRLNVEYLDGRKSADERKNEEAMKAAKQQQSSAVR